MPTILVVDDQRCIRELVKEELGDEGYTIVAARDALSAKKQLRSFRPDLVLLDLFLGEPDGWDVLRDIKLRAPYVPVIVFTAYDSFKEDPRLYKVDGYVIKSTDFRELKEKIATTLSDTIDQQGDLETRTCISQMGVAQSF
jgi:DNA-binding response OmpR family regulator